MRRLAVLVALPLLVGACGDDDDDDGAAAGGDFCDRATIVDERFTDLEESFEGDGPPDPAVFEEAADNLDGLAEGAPDEVREDLRTVADAAREIGSVFADVDFDDPEALSDPALAERVSELEERGEDVEEATQRVEAYLEEECGIVSDSE